MKCIMLCSHCDIALHDLLIATNKFGFSAQVRKGGIILDYFVL